MIQLRPLGNRLHLKVSERDLNFETSEEGNSEEIEHLFHMAAGEVVHIPRYNQI
jgi:hypothetical protein